jgi:hypothetical protein
MPQKAEHEDAEEHMKPPIDTPPAGDDPCRVVAIVARTTRLVQ